MSDTQFLQPRRANKPAEEPATSESLNTTASPALNSDNPDRSQPDDAEPLLVPYPLETNKAPTPIPEMGAGVWKLKDIGLWPDVRAGGMYRRNVKVLIQVNCCAVHFESNIAQAIVSSFLAEFKWTL